MLQYLIFKKSSVGSAQCTQKTLFKVFMSYHISYLHSVNHIECDRIAYGTQHYRNPLELSSPCIQAGIWKSESLEGNFIMTQNGSP